MHRSITTLSLLIIATFLFALSSCVRKTQTEQPSTPIVQAEPHKSLPQQIGTVNDFANLLDPKQEDELAKTLKEFRDRAGIDFVVVTQDTTGDQSIFDYSIALARQWKVGNGGKGLLLLLAIKDRQWHLQVSRALEKELPNEVCKQFGDEASKFYKQGKYFEGVEENIRLIINRLSQPKH